jgi:predicted RNA-binding Zn-ribbon protein involved in translation (DUF1610 family)
MMAKEKNLMKLRWFSLVCLFISIPTNFIGGVLSIRFLSIVGILSLMIFIVITLLFWKCPHCGIRLPIRFNINEDIDDNYICPYCNRKF